MKRKGFQPTNLTYGFRHNTKSLIDGQQVTVLEPGYIPTPFIPRKLSHRWVLVPTKPEAERFCQLRQRQGHLCTYAYDGGDYLISWHYPTRYEVLQASAPGGSHHFRIVVAEVIVGTDPGEIRKLNSGYWGILKIVREWRFVKRTRRRLRKRKKLVGETVYLDDGRTERRFKIKSGFEIEKSNGKVALSEAYQLAKELNS